MKPAPEPVAQAETEFIPPESTESQFEELPPDFWDAPADDAPAARPAPVTPSKQAAPAMPAPAAGRGLALIQELFPGKVLSVEKFAESEDETELGVESESYEHPEADEGSPEGSGEDA